MTTTAKRTKSEEIELLSRPLKPLFSSSHRLAVFFSAKAGCTFAVKWYLSQVGLLDDALNYSPWIHDFRREVLYQSPDYESSLYTILNPEFRIIKFVREPYSRASSSYIHAVKYGYENERISNFLGREVNAKKGFSFEEFVTYLESIDLRRCDPHHRLQVHFAEEENIVNLNFIVKVENSLEKLPKIEQSLGLKSIHLTKLKQSVHHTQRSEKEMAYIGDRILSSFQISQEKLTIPPTKCFYNDSISKKIQQLYDLDFKFYNYSSTIAQL